MDNFNLKKYLAEGKLTKSIIKEEYNFESSDFNSSSEEEIIEDILDYFKYERDERPEDMGDPDWWEGNPPFEGMSDDEIKTIIKSIISSEDFTSPEIQGDYDTPMDLAWEIYNEMNK